MWRGLASAGLGALWLAAGVAAQEAVRTTVFHGVELPYEVIDGWAVHAGDMILGTAEEALLRSNDPVHDAAPYPKAVLWPRGVVPYVIDDDVPRPEWIREAIRIWNRKTVIRFIPRTAERDYLRFAVRDTGCYGVFGRGYEGGERIMPVEPRGCPTPITLHELGHAIGLWHEQQRRDRDRYVRVFPENISEWGHGQWFPHALAGPDIGPYDYRSVMHYSFSSDDLRRHGHIRMAETIPPGMPMGNTWELSPGDVDSVSRLYGRVPQRHVVSTNPPGLEIIVDGRRMTAPASFRWRVGSRHTLEVPAPQYRRGARFRFGRWSDGGRRRHTITANRGTTLFQASFVAQYRLGTAAVPAGSGTVAVRPAPDADGFHTLRTPVELTAKPANGWSFQTWDVESDYWWHGIVLRRMGQASNPARTFAMQGMVARAHFADGPLFRIDSNVEAVPVTVDGDRVMAPAAFPAGRFGGTATVGTEPIDTARRAYRHRFRGWSDGGEQTHAVDVPIDEDSTLRLRLATDYRLTIDDCLGGACGAVLATPRSADGFYREGAEVRLLASPTPPDVFLGWTGDAWGNAPTALVRMKSGRHVRAAFGLPLPCLRHGTLVHLEARQGQLVRALGGGGGAVRANRRWYSAGGQERLRVEDPNGGCVASGDTVYLRATNGRYLRVVNGGGAALDAAGTGRGRRTAFVVERRRGGDVARVDYVSLVTSSGHYVVAERGGGGALHARGRSPSPRATFRVCALERGACPSRYVR